MDGRPNSNEAFLQRVEQLRDRIAPQFPDIDPGDLLLIVKALLRPTGPRRRMFLRKIRPDVYVV